MPPKKKGKKKDKEPPPPPPEPELKFEDTLDDTEVLDLDLLGDINDDFFSEAYKIMQFLMEANRNFEASRIKRYVDIIYNMHRKYSDEVKENNVLRPQITSAENKLRFALELTATSEEQMVKLKESLGDAWKEADASVLREQIVQEKLQEYVLKCEGFGEKGMDATDDTAEFGHLAKYKNIILRERDRLSSEVIDLEKRLTLNRYYSENLEYIIRNNEDTMNKLTVRAKLSDAEKSNMEVKMRTLMNNLNEQKESQNKTLIKMDQIAKEAADIQNRLTAKTNDFDRQRLQMDKYRSENLMNHKVILKLEEEITELQRANKNSEDIIRSLRLIEKEKTNTINQLTSKVKKLVEDQSYSTSKLYKMNRENVALNSEITRLKNQVNSLEKDVITAVGKIDDMRRLKENVQRERDNLRSDIIKLNNQIGDFKHDMILKSNIIDNLNLDINKMNVKLDEAHISKSKAEKERDEMAQEVETLHERIENYQDQVQLKTTHITNLTEKLQSMQSEVFNMKKQLETVHSEKMMLQRNLETCTQERDNFRVLQAKTSHQLTQQVNEITMNQNKINSLNMKIEHLNNDKKELQSDLKNTENLLASVRKELKETKTKNEQLLKTISNDELKFMKMSQELDETRKERNLVGLQMVRRNDEIVLLKEKLSITQNALDQGQTQYNQRVEDIRLLKKEISNLQTERDCLTRAIKSTANMREEVVRLQRALNQERIRIRALTEDAKTPTGVHRWRILKGEDPNKYQLLEKLQLLQKRMLKQAIENTNLKARLGEIQKSNDSLKRMLANMPTIEVKHKLVVQQRINRQMGKKMKALTAELAMDEVELKARECMLKKYREQLRDLKNENAVMVPVMQSVTDLTTAGGQHDVPISESDSDSMLLVDPAMEQYRDLVPFSSAESNISQVCKTQIEL